MKSKFWIFLFCLMMLSSVVFASGETMSSEVSINTVSNAMYKDTVKSFKGTVVRAGEKYIEEDEWSREITPYQDVRVRIDQDGYFKIVDVKYQLSYYLGSVIPADPLNVGDKVYVSISYDSNGGIESTYIEYINNERFLVAMIILYSGAIILIGGMKGVRALVGLIITVLAVFFIMVPLIYDGYDSILVTVLTSIGIIAITFVIVSGFTKQTLAASLGTAGGIIVAGIFAIVFGNLMKLTGACEDSLQLSMIEGGSRFNFENIMISGVIVGALGACMDVGMSIASALHELSVEGNGMTIKKLIRSGMNIGKDVMGTMTNTLILAYVGSSLTVILMLKGYGFEAYQIANNTQLVLEEVVRAIAGSFGLVITIPITTLVSSVLMGKRESDLIGK